jgi:hypothetical protein
MAAQGRENVRDGWEASWKQRHKPRNCPSCESCGNKQPFTATLWARRFRVLAQRFPVPQLLAELCWSEPSPNQVSRPRVQGHASECFAGGPFGRSTGRLALMLYICYYKHSIWKITFESPYHANETRNTVSVCNEETCTISMLRV